MSEATTMYHTAATGCNRPGLSSIDRLIATTVGREDTIADLTDQLDRQAADTKNRHVIISGPPGSGKTHLLKVLGQRWRQSRSFTDSYMLVPFPTDNYRLLSFTDWLLDLLRLVCWYHRDVTAIDHYAHLQSLDSNMEINRQAGEYLSEFTRQSGRKLVVLFDRADRLIFETKKGIGIEPELQGFLQNFSELMFVGTSSAIFADFNDELAGLLKQQFRHLPLLPFSEDETRAFIRLNLTWDGHSSLLSDSNAIVSKTQALQHMTGGNPRLVMAFYELIINENRFDIKNLFEMLLDRLTPFYYERLNGLTRKEAAVLATLVTLRDDLPTQTLLTRKMRIRSHCCAGALNRLQQLNLVTAGDHPNDKRSKVYRIREGFFELWLATGQMQEPQRFMPLLVEFVSRWYADPVSRELKRQQLWSQLLRSDRARSTSHNENAEILLFYLTDLGEYSENCQTKLELAFHYAQTGRPQLAKNLLQMISANPDQLYTYQWVNEQIYLCINDNIQPDVLTTLSDIFISWRDLRIGREDQVVSRLHLISNQLQQFGFHQMNVGLLSEIVEYRVPEPLRPPLMAKIAQSLVGLGQYQQAFDLWQQICQITEKTADLKSQATALNNLSQLYQDQGYLDAALSHNEQALKILRQIGDDEAQSVTLNNRATIYYAQGYYEKALENLEQAQFITQQTGDIATEAITLSNLSLIFHQRDDTEKAVEYLETSLKYMRQLRNRDGEITTLINLSQIYRERHDLDTAENHLATALSRLRETPQDRRIVEVLIQIGFIRWDKGDTELALTNWAEAHEVAIETRLSQQWVRPEGMIEKRRSSTGYDFPVQPSRSTDG
jgi:tetratricopeptide (TPR) repeat protein